MKFNEWLKKRLKLKENMTSTGDVACFSRPLGGMVRRGDKKKKKKK